MALGRLRLSGPMMPKAAMIPKAVTLLKAIRLDHTVFALPFALAAAVVASNGWPRGRTLTWIFVAMVEDCTAGVLRWTPAADGMLT